MAAIRLNNGSVLLKNGLVSCQCCTEINDLFINLGEPLDCDCVYDIATGQDNEGNHLFLTDQPRPCFTEADPAPQIVNINGQNVTNIYYPLAYWGGSSALQIPWDLTTTPAPGWKSFVESPTIVQLSGTVGGDVIIRGQTIGSTSRYQGSPPEAINFSFIPQEGEFPCGDCEKNGPHAFSGQFVMYPFTIYTINIVTYLRQTSERNPETNENTVLVPICSPWLRGRIQVIGPYAP